jgi:hypothetical protein
MLPNAPAPRGLKLAGLQAKAVEAAGERYKKERGERGALRVDIVDNALQSGSTN